MSSVVEISVPAPTRGLLTAEQLRAAAGVASDDTSRDTELAAIGLTVADIICKTGCQISGDGITPVTLRQETLVETFYPCPRRGSNLILARRFLGTVALVENGVTLTALSDYTVNKGAGILTRRSNGCVQCWACTAIVVTYQAGFAEVPTDLADVAYEVVSRRTGTARDPLTRMERIEQVGVETIERQFWVDANDATDLTPDMQGKLAYYRSGIVV